MSERTLVTGFGPFLNVTENPSARLAEAAGRPFHVLDVTYEGVERFVSSLELSSFDRLLMLGVATGRKHLCPEMFARNTYGAVADSQGSTRSGAIREGAPLLLSSTLFVDEPLAELLANDARLQLSMDAGSYLCNFAYFKALDTYPQKQIGFLHVPLFDFVPFDDQLKSLTDLLGVVESFGQS
jgi:pyroglutamyl-peptidase